MSKGQTSGPIWRIAWTLLSYGVAGVCLYWVFHDLNLRQVWHSLAGVRWCFAAPVAALDVLVYMIAGWEWRILLGPAGRLSLLRSTQGILAGRFANDVLPVHVGYVVRLYLASKWLRQKVAAVAPSLVVERLFDGFWLALGIGLAGAFLSLPAKIARIAEVWAVLIVISLVVAACVVFRKGGTWNPSSGGIFRWKGARVAREFIGRVISEMRSMGRSWIMPAAFALSFLKFATLCFSFLCLLYAYGFYFPFWHQMAMFMIAYVGISMPSTPASAGVFQVFCMAGLEMFHVPRPAAAGFAMMAFVLLTAPLTLAGFFAMAQSGLTLRDVRARAEQWEKTRDS